MPMMISTTDSPSRIMGFHGGSNVLWKGLGAPSIMFGDWDAIECGIFPPEAVAGVHFHNHTEEMWLAISGRAVVTLSDQEKEVGPGDVILSSFDALHGTRQIGEEPYTCVAILANVTVPRTRNLRKGETLGRYHVAKLRKELKEGVELDGIQGSARIATIQKDSLRSVLKAPWQSISLISLDPGSSFGPRTLDSSEAFIFVTSGRGIAHSHYEDVDLAPNTSLTLLLDTVLHLEGGEEPLEFFFVELGVPGVS